MDVTGGAGTGTPTLRLDTGNAVLIAVSMTVEPTSPSTVRGVPS